MLAEIARREFEHKPSAELFGVITKVAEGSWPYGFYPVLVVRDDDGTEHILSCYLSLSWLAAPVIAHRPKVGERIGLRCDEPETSIDDKGKTKSYNRGVIEFEDDTDTPVDWDRMIESRRRDRDEKKPGSNGGTNTGTTDPWAGKSVDEATKTWEADTRDVNPEPPY